MTTEKAGYERIDAALLRAEAFCAELTGNGFPFDDFIIVHDGSFRKSYRPDVDDLKKRYADSGEPQLQVTITRDGLYDRLPEGLFHQPRSSQTSGTQVMVSEYRRYREEEKAARRFFQPLEQEIFRASVAVEQEERSLMSNMLSGNLRNIFFSFWEIDAGLPPEAAAVLVRIRPWANIIKGNRDVTAKALGMMLGLPVKAETRTMATTFSAGSSMSLGEAGLGTEMICGRSITEYSNCWAFTISGVPAAGISQYLEDAPLGRFLNKFEEIFIPVETDIIFDFELEQSAEDAAETEQVLGYSMLL